MADEFSCTPSVAWQQLMEETDLVFEILDARAFARMKEAIDRRGAGDPGPSGDLADLVWEVRAAIWDADQERRP